MSLDGYGAGPRQSLDNPFGARGLALHEWAYNTRTFHAMHGKDGGSSGVDDDFVARGFDNIGAWIIGRINYSVRNSVVPLPARSS
jgi:hypothetical protein